MVAITVWNVLYSNVYFYHFSATFYTLYFWHSDEATVFRYEQM